MFNGFADWEIAYVTPEINKNEHYELIYFSAHGGPVSSMGGLSVSTTSALSEIEPEQVDLLILPGGVAWETGKNKLIGPLVKKVFSRGIPIAAICAATTYLGQLGLLNHMKHTSNDLAYLKEIAPEYDGEAFYQHELAFSDKNIITANGIAPIEFAREIFKTINLFENDQLDKWYQLFKNGIWTE